MCNRNIYIYLIHFYDSLRGPEPPAGNSCFMRKILQKIQSWKLVPLNHPKSFAKCCISHTLTTYFCWVVIQLHMNLTSSHSCEPLTKGFPVCEWEKSLFCSKTHSLKLKKESWSRQDADSGRECQLMAIHRVDNRKPQWRHGGWGNVKEVQTNFSGTCWGYVCQEAMQRYYFIVLNSGQREGVCNDGLCCMHLCPCSPP